MTSELSRIHSMFRRLLVALAALTAPAWAAGNQCVSVCAACATCVRDLPVAVKPTPVATPVSKPKPSPKPVANPVAAKPVAAADSADSVILDIPGRYQFTHGNGYCGEVTLQMIMAKQGVWIPQQVARYAGGGELLPGVNYERAMKALGIRFKVFRGSGYDDFVAFAKRELSKKRAVVAVTFLRGFGDDDYDHIIPIVGFDSKALYIHTGFSTKVVRRPIAGFGCITKKDGIERGGCIPHNTRWGYSILGDSHVEVVGNSPRETTRGIVKTKPGYEAFCNGIRVTDSTVALPAGKVTRCEARAARKADS